jgi:chaperonin cofactor prefoldin
LEQAGVLKSGTDTEQLRVMNSSLNEMDKLQDDNDKLLLELDKLQAELTRLATAGYDSRTDAIIDEIRTLTDDTHYYAR